MKKQFKFYKKKPSAIEIRNALELMNNKNPALQKLIDTFDLQLIKTEINNLKQKTIMKTNVKKPEVKKTETKTESKTIYPKGIMLFTPHEKAPDFVKGMVVINIAGLEAFINDNPDYISEHPDYGSQMKLKLLEGDNGLYLAVDTYKKPS